MEIQQKVNMTKKLFIVRGLPGSGKSTFAKTLAELTGASHFEADMYFIDSEGNYNFDAGKLYQAHKWCQDNVENTMTFGKPVIVSNTSTTEKEVKTYTDLAEKHGYTVVSLIVENRHGGSNIHGVPADRLEAMKNRFVVKL